MLTPRPYSFTHFTNIQKNNASHPLTNEEASDVPMLPASASLVLVLLGTSCAQPLGGILPDGLSIDGGALTTTRAFQPGDLRTVGICSQVICHMP